MYHFTHKIVSKIVAEIQIHASGAYFFLSFILLRYYPPCMYLSFQITDLSVSFKSAKTMKENTDSTTIVPGILIMFGPLYHLYPQKQ